MKNRLEINCKNIIFQNPFILASAPPTRNAEMISRAFDLGWAGAVIKTICLNYQEMINVSPRLAGFKNGNKLTGLQNIELISDRSPEVWVEDIKFLKNKHPEKIIIASISAEADNITAWQKLAVMMQEAGADILELNLSCPHGLPEKGMGQACCDIPKISASITKCVKDVSAIPVWVKLSANVTNLNNIAKVCVDAGADGVTAVNTIKGFSGIDIETGLPKLDVNGKSACGGFSGSIIKPFALKSVAEIAGSQKCFVSASGGVNSWEDAVEFMLLGASTVQVCTRVMFEGYGVINELTAGLNDYLERKNISSLNDIIGGSLNKISDFAYLDKEAKIYPEIDKTTCVKCGKCFVSCRDGGCQAIEFTPGSLPEFDKEKCSGCGLCGIICPAGSIRLS